MAASKPDLSNEWDRDKLRNWMSNAKRMNRLDVYEDAFRQLCRVEGRNIDDPLEAAFAGVMRALEEALTEESGRTKRLSRTRQKHMHGLPLTTEITPRLVKKLTSAA